MEQLFRDLQSNEVDCRVAQCKQNGLQLLLYKNARTDSTILDETFGWENWQDRYYECKGNLYCSLGVNINYNQPDKEPVWIWKDDCGSESNTEKEKGEASDAFKRSAFRFGVGKPLYTSPFVWIKSDKCNIYDTGKTDKYGRPIYACKDKFYVKWIKYEGGNIVQLLIYNSTQKRDAYAYGMSLDDDVKLTEGITVEQIEKIMANYPNKLINQGLNGRALYSVTADEGDKLIKWLDKKFEELKAKND